MADGHARDHEGAAPRSGRPRPPQPARRRLRHRRLSRLGIPHRRVRPALRIRPQPRGGRAGASCGSRRRAPRRAGRRDSVRRRLIRPRRAERRAATRGRTGGRCLARRAATRAEGGAERWSFARTAAGERGASGTTGGSTTSDLLREQLEAAGFRVERLTHANSVLSAWGSIRGKRPRPPTGTTCGIPASSGALVNAIGSYAARARSAISEIARPAARVRAHAVRRRDAGRRRHAGRAGVLRRDVVGLRPRVRQRRVEGAGAAAPSGGGRRPARRAAGGRARRRHGRRRAAGRARSPGLARYGDRHRPCDGGACARAAATR